MNIIKIILYPSPLAPFFGNEEDLKLRCKLEWPYLPMHRAGSREGGAWPPLPNPENQFENGAKFLCLKGKGRTILHQKCFNVNSSGHKEPRNCYF